MSSLHIIRMGSDYAAEITGKSRAVLCLEVRRREPASVTMNNEHPHRGLEATRWVVQLTRRTEPIFSEVGSRDSYMSIKC